MIITQYKNNDIVKDGIFDISKIKEIFSDFKENIINSLGDVGHLEITLYENEEEGKTLRSVFAGYKCEEKMLKQMYGNDGVDWVSFTVFEYRESDDFEHILNRAACELETRLIKLKGSWVYPEDMNLNTGDSVNGGNQLTIMKLTDNYVQLSDFSIYDRGTLHLRAGAQSAVKTLRYDLKKGRLTTGETTEETERFIKDYAHAVFHDYLHRGRRNDITVKEMREIVRKALHDFADRRGYKAEEETTKDKDNG